MHPAHVTDPPRASGSCAVNCQDARGEESTRAAEGEHVARGAYRAERTRAAEGEHVARGVYRAKRTRAAEGEHVARGASNAQGATGHADGLAVALRGTLGRA
jgi:hypothetical protein